MYIRSKYTIVPKAFRKTRYKVRITLENLKIFPEFLVAAVIACIGKRLKQKAKHRPALINEDALRGLSFATNKRQRHLPISLSYIGTCLNKSVSWVDKFKKRPKRLKLISVKHNFIPTEIPWENRFSYMSYHGISFGRAKKFRTKLHVVGTDLLLSNVYIFKGKKV
ncbi:hypothetical protein A0256_13870 [Mucilaginibacter sp. PAMC 26640]|nr:hypothetical protein A0256_13870 [Mucilaginibacter sp. PAMC 26640]